MTSGKSLSLFYRNLAGCVCLIVFSRIINNKAAKARPNSCVTREEGVGEGRGGGRRGGRMIENIKQG